MRGEVNRCLGLYVVFDIAQVRRMINSHHRCIMIIHRSLHQGGDRCIACSAAQVPARATNPLGPRIAF